MTTPQVTGFQFYIDADTLKGDGSPSNPVSTLASAQTSNPWVIDPPITPAALPSVPAVTADYDPASRDTVVRVIPHLNGSIIGGLVPGVVSAGGTPAQAHGEIRILRNMGPASSTQECNLVILQDNVGSAYPFHLGSRRPYLTIPNLCTGIFQYDNPTNKWHLVSLSDEGQAGYPRKIVPAGPLAAGNVNDYHPVDAITGMSFRHVNHVVVQGAVGTVITGFDATTPAGSLEGWRFKLRNTASGLTLAYLDVNSAVGNRIRTPTGAGYVVPQYGTVWLAYDQDDGTWWVEDC